MVSCNFPKNNLTGLEFKNQHTDELLMIELGTRRARPLFKTTLPKTLATFAAIFAATKLLTRHAVFLQHNHGLQKCTMPTFIVVSGH